MAAPRQPTALWALFGFDGRISREVFWLGNFACGFVFAALTLPTLNEVTGQFHLPPWFSLIVPVFTWAAIALAVKRLHDRGLSGFFVVVLFLPFVNILATLVIGLIPGDPGPNKHGPATNTRQPR